jgi:hypothetical protein
MNTLPSEEEMLARAQRAHDRERSFTILGVMAFLTLLGLLMKGQTWVAWLLAPVMLFVVLMPVLILFGAALLQGLE